MKTKKQNKAKQQQHKKAVPHFFTHTKRDMLSLKNQLESLPSKI